jgi:transposase
MPVVESAKDLPNRESKVRLNALLEANQALMTAYVMKDALKALWHYKREGWARKAWENWLAMATSSGLLPLVRFATEVFSGIGPQSRVRARSRPFQTCKL